MCSILTQTNEQLPQSLRKCKYSFYVSHHSEQISANHKCGSLKLLEILIFFAKTFNGIAAQVSSGGLSVCVCVGVASPRAQEVQLTLLPLQGLPPSGHLPLATHLQQVSAPEHRGRAAQINAADRRFGQSATQSEDHFQLISTSCNTHVHQTQAPTMCQQQICGSASTFCRVRVSVSTPRLSHPIRTRSSVNNCTCYC